MINLNTTYPINADGPARSLPVLVDLNWYGHVMTSDNAGIIPSRNTKALVSRSDDEVVL